MATLPTSVQPGQVISTDLMNAVLGAIAQLSGSTATGTQAVPNVFGAFLGDARATLIDPSRQLQLGFVLDVTGAAVDPLITTNRTRLVLNQNPAADQRVAPNTPVNLVVSGSTGGSAPAPAPAPTISRTESTGGIPGTSFRVGETFVLVGTNFSATASLNTVTFDGRPAASVTNDPADVTRRLNLTVPAGINGAPVNPGDPARNGVVLSVTTPGNNPVTTTITVTAPSGLPLPAISGFTPAAQSEGGSLTINGSNFSTVLARNQVTIGGQAATVNTATAGQLVVLVPQYANLPAGNTRVVQVSVTTLDPNNVVIGTAVSGATLTVVGA